MKNDFVEARFLVKHMNELENEARAAVERKDMKTAANMLCFKSVKTFLK